MQPCLRFLRVKRAWKISLVDRKRTKVTSKTRLNMFEEQKLEFVSNPCKMIAVEEMRDLGGVIFVPISKRRCATRLCRNHIYTNQPTSSILHVSNFPVDAPFINQIVAVGEGLCHPSQSLVGRIFRSLMHTYVR